jgi:hypothetical protein
MKKIFLLLSTIVVFSSSSFSQIDIGVKAGGAWSSVSNLGETNTNKPILTGYGGGFAHIKLNDNFVLVPELLYSLKGFKYTPYFYNQYSKQYLNYLSFPILIGFKPSKDFMFDIGPEFGYLFKSITLPGASTKDLSVYYNKIDIDIDLGVAYFFEKKFGMELRYSYGLKNLANKTLMDFNGSMIDRVQEGKTGSLQLGLFYKLTKF